MGVDRFLKFQTSDGDAAYIMPGAVMAVVEDSPGGGRCKVILSGGSNVIIVQQPADEVKKIIEDA